MPTARTPWPLGLARRLHRELFYPLLAFALPSVCFACRARLGPLQRLGACGNCWADLRILEPPLCPGCGLPGARGTDLLGPARGRCAACVLDPPAADAVRAAVAYDAAARAFLLRAKLGHRAELLRPLGLQLARVLECTSYAARSTSIVPVPSHPWMNLRRGFVPALVLARVVARRLDLPIRPRVLARSVRGRTSVKRLRAPGRRAHASRAFRVRGAVAGERLLLIDDVMTTGATVEACARALKQAGAHEVRVAAWARRLIDETGAFDRPRTD